MGFESETVQTFYEGLQDKIFTSKYIKLTTSLLPLKSLNFEPEGKFQFNNNFFKW